MLEVVEDEQEPAVGDSVGKAVPRFERLSGDLEHELRVAERGKRGPEDAVGIVVGGFRGRLEREPGLARSGRAGQRQQAGVPACEQGRHLLEFSLPPEEGRRRNREVRPLQARQRRERLAAELVDPLRRGEILQSVFAEVAQALAPDQRCGRGRDEDLPTVPGRCDAGCSVDVRSDVALVGDVRCPGVDPHAHADRSGRKHLLSFGSGGNCGRRCGERDEERVALRIHFDPVVANERLTQGAAMLRQRVCVGIGTQLLQEPRRALDVGEDKSDGSGRKLARHAAIQSRRVQFDVVCALPSSAH